MKKFLPVLFFAISNWCLAQDGTLDHSFGTDGKAYQNDYQGVGKILIQPDKKILQSVTPYTDHEIYGVVRYNANGTPDNAFGTAGVASMAVSEFSDINQAIALTADGKVVLGGYSYFYNQVTFEDTAKLTLVRFTAAGQPDLTFNGTGSMSLYTPGTDSKISEIKMLAGGKMLVVGVAEVRTPYSYHTFVMRFNPDGSVDNSFGMAGRIDVMIGSGNNMLTAVEVMANGSFVIAGRATAGSPAHLQFAVAKFIDNGTPDVNFAGTGTLLIDAAPTSSYAQSLAIQPDGKIILCGNSKYYSYSDEQFTTIRLNTDGSPDNTFNGTGMAFATSSNQTQNAINSVLVQNDGKIVLSGIVRFFNTITHAYTSDFTVIRYTPAGIKDVTFKSDYEVLQTGTTGGAGQIYLDGGLDDEFGFLAFQGTNLIVAGTSTWRPQGAIFDLPRMIVSRLNNVTGAVLPVRLTNFTATATGAAALLKWKISQEVNSARFDVERSSDALIFTKIGSVNAAGNSNVALEYNFTDNAPLTGLNYYRIKQVDADGKFVYTPARVLNFANIDAKNVSYFPNPTSGTLYVELPASVRLETASVNIFNAAGAVVYQQKLPPGSQHIISINMQKFAKGTYFIQIKTESVNNTQRVVLQ